MNKPNIITTTVSPEVHQLPGIGVIAYSYDIKRQLMSLTIDNRHIKDFNGEYAEKIFKNVAGFREESDPYVLEAADRAYTTYGLTFKEICNPTRKDEIVKPRQVMMWWLKNNTKKSLTAIGAAFGKFDHNTVDHACKTVDNLIETDMDFRRKVEQFLNAI